MLRTEIGTTILQSRAAIGQLDETPAQRKGREAVVVLLLLSPVILGLAISNLPRKS